VSTGTPIPSLRARLKRSPWLVARVHSLRSVPALARSWIRYGSYWWRKGPDGLPVPPPGLLHLVAGTADPSWFLDSGRRGFQSIVDTLARNGIEASRLSAVLDFGCGCGRVTRYWQAFPEVHVHGADYNPRLVAWNSRHLPFGRFAVNRPDPPLPYSDASFDLAYALSVFTHLPEESQVAWMKELRRILRPGGYLLLTTHGDSYREKLPPSLRQAYDRGELVVVDEAHLGTNFCNAFQPPVYVREKLAEDWRVIDFVPSGALGNPTQDLFLLQRPA
jgi:SAM-dependent methyltransferase